MGAAYNQGANYFVEVSFNAAYKQGRLIIEDMVVNEGPLQYYLAE